MDPKTINTQLKKLCVKKDAIREIYKGITYHNNLCYSSNGYIFLSVKLAYAPVLEGKTCNPFVKQSLIGGRTYIQTNNGEPEYIEQKVSEYIKEAKPLSITLDDIKNYLDTKSENNSDCVTIGNARYLKSNLQIFYDIATSLELNEQIYISKLFISTNNKPVEPIMIVNDVFTLMISNFG